MAWAAVGAAAIGGAASIYGAKQAEAPKAKKAIDIFAPATKGPNIGTNLVGRQATGLLDYYDQNTGKFLDLSERCSCFQDFLSGTVQLRQFFSPRRNATLRSKHSAIRAQIGNL